MAKSIKERQATERKKSDADAWLKGQGAGEATGVKLPEGIGWWKPKVGLNRIDVIPFVAGDGNPFADKGYEHWERQYYRHYVPGFDGNSKPYACLGNWKEKCPICEYVHSLDKERDKDAIQSMKGKLQILMNVVDLDDREKDKIYVWEAVYYNRQKGFGEQLITALRSQPKYKNFSDLKAGFTLHLNAVEEQGGRSKYVCVTRIDFEPRKHSYADDFIEKAACLDDCLVKHSYADLKRLVTGGPPEDEEDGEHRNQSNPSSAGRSSPRTSPPPDDQGTDKEPDEDERSESVVRAGNTVSHPKVEGKLTVISVNPQKTKAKCKDEGGKEHVLAATELSAWEDPGEEDDDTW